MTDVIAGRFALCDPLARGGSGTVWRAWDRRQNRLCAAKVLRRRDAGDLLRFVREQSVRLTHDHVLTPYSWAAEDAHVVIASELVDGGSLSTLIGDWGPLSEPTVAVLLDQLLEALEQVHAAGLIHRDVKPGNLLLRASGQGPLHALLGDFGLAIGSRDAHLTEVGTVVGTPGYLAPEVLRGGVAPDIRHDLYAAGRVAVALLNGAEPRDFGAVDPEAGPGLLRDLVLALTAVDVRDRPPSASAVRAALAPLLTDRRAVTRSGESVDVLHQLPPLGPDVLAEAQGLRGVDATTPTTPMSTGDPGSPTAPSVTEAASPITVAPTTASPTTVAPTTVAPTTPPPPPSPPPPLWTAATAPTANLPRDLSRARSPRRRRLGAAAAAAVVAVAVPVAVVLTRDTTTPSTGPGLVPAGVVVVVGHVCMWQQQGDAERTASGSRAVCAATDGTYLWTSS